MKCKPKWIILFYKEEQIPDDYSSITTTSNFYE